MAFFRSFLRQSITVWKQDSVNQFGEPSFSSPTTQKGRREQKSEIVKDSQGNDVMATGIYYLDKKDTDVNPGDFLFLGTSTSTAPTNVTNAEEAMNVEETPSMDAQESLIKVIV